MISPNLCGSHLQSQSELNNVSWGTLVIDLISQQVTRNYVAMLLVVCQLSRDVIAYEDW